MREYKLHRPAEANEATVAFEIVGNGLKRIRHSHRLKPPGQKPRLPNGRQKGATCRGWTPDTRRTVRELLEENRNLFQNFAHLKLQTGDCHDSKRLRRIFDKICRWIQRNFDNAYYFLVLEFMHRSTDPHFHVALSIRVPASTHEKLERYWRKISGGGELTLDSKPNEAVEAIARYSAKSETKTNPPWFDKEPFRPYRQNLPKLQRTKIVIPVEEAREAGLLEYRFTHDGQQKLEEHRRSSRRKTSSLSDIHGSTDKHDTGKSFPMPASEDISPEKKASDNEDKNGGRYKASSEKELMAKACRTCWFRFGRYVPQQGELCPKCSDRWEPAA